MIAYVESPFQLLQVYEFNEQRKGLNKVYIRINGKIENDKQLKSLSGLLLPEKCNLIRIEKNIEKIFHYSIFLYLALINSQIIIGDANSFLFKLLKFFLPRSKFILLDDGVATINDGKINEIYNRFTIFPKYVNNTINNEFNAVKKLIRNKEKKLQHIIIGSNFVDEGICSEESYDKAINKIINNLTLNKIPCIYIPHRGESDHQVLRIKNKFPVEVIKTEYPIELIGYELGVYPASISHTLSTAVYSMNKIYNNVDIYTYKLPSSETLSRKKSLNSLYRRIEDERFSILIN